MEYQVPLSDQADAELGAADLFLLQRSPEAALQWYMGVRAAINSLPTFPRRCALARENGSYPDNEVRPLKYVSYCRDRQDSRPKITINAL